MDTLDLSDTVPIDTFKLTIIKPGSDKPTGWVIELAGPAHPQSVALSSEISRESIEREKAIEFAQVNGRKWKVDDETVDQRRRRNVTRVCKRIVSWSPNPVFRMVSDEPIPFTLENAVNLFLRPELGAYFLQVTEYLGGERAFMPPSEPI